MKHPRSPELRPLRQPPRCPCGSGAMQLLWLPKSGCERGLRGRGAWTVPAGHTAGGLCRAEPHAAAITMAKGSGRRTEPKAPDPAGDSLSLQQDRFHPGSSGDDTSTAAATHPGWHISCKSQLISLGFSDTMD